MFMKKLFTLFAALSVFFLLLPAGGVQAAIKSNLFGPQDGVPDGWRRLHMQYGFSMMVPQNWIVIGKEESVAEGKAISIGGAGDVEKKQYVVVMLMNKKDMPLAEWQASTVLSYAQDIKKYERGAPLSKIGLNAKTSALTYTVLKDNDQERKSCLIPMQNHTVAVFFERPTGASLEALHEIMMLRSIQAEDTGKSPFSAKDSQTQKINNAFGLSYTLPWYWTSLGHKAKPGKSEDANISTGLSMFMLDKVSKLPDWGAEARAANADKFNAGLGERIAAESQAGIVANYEKINKTGHILRNTEASLGKIDGYKTVFIHTLVKASTHMEKANDNICTSSLWAYVFIGDKTLRMTLLTNQMLNPEETMANTDKLLTPPLPQSALDIISSLKINEKAFLAAP